MKPEYTGNTEGSVPAGGVKVTVMDLLCPADKVKEVSLRVAVAKSRVRDSGPFAGKIVSWQGH